MISNNYYIDERLSELIDLKNIKKKYDNRFELDISMKIDNGKVVVLAGKNGAGKSTFIKCITGLINSGGKALVDGVDIRKVEGKRNIAYSPEIPEVFDYLTVYEHLELYSITYDIKEWDAVASYLLEKMELSKYKDVVGKELSKGTKQKLSLCCSLIREGCFIILDEPFTGLDPYAMKNLKDIINEKKGKGCTFLISTHILESLEDIWDEMYIIDNGKIIKKIMKKDNIHILNAFFDESKESDTNMKI